jgi:hypothetical protein
MSISGRPSAAGVPRERGKSRGSQAHLGSGHPQEELGEGRRENQLPTIKSVGSFTTIGTFQVREDPAGIAGDISVTKVALDPQ